MGVTLTHQLPGRIRVYVEDISNHPIRAARLQAQLLSIKGVQYVSCNPSTGRALLFFDDAGVTTAQLITHISNWCNSLDFSSSSVQDLVAATSEPGVLPTMQTGTLPTSASEQTFLNNPYTLPTIASAGLLGVLSAKHLFFGRSAWAYSPWTFYFSAGISIVAGYPALRRGVEAFIRNKSVTPDLWVGLGTLATAVLRENLFALSSITLLNAAMLHRRQVALHSEEAILDKGLERHTRKMTKLATWLTPLTLLGTRSPMRALGVLLAANPRPSILAHKYRWAKSEEAARGQGLWVPEAYSLEKLSAARTIVFSTLKELYQDSGKWRVKSVSQNMSPRKVVGLAASLLRHDANSPLSMSFQNMALQEKCTLHTAFQVVADDTGTRGVIQGHPVSVGSKDYIEHAGVDLAQILLEERRMRRDGFKTHLVTYDEKVVGIIGRKQHIPASWARLLDQLHQDGYDLRVLSPARVPDYSIESISRPQLEQMFTPQDPFILVTGDNAKEGGSEGDSVISISMTDLSRLYPTLQFCQQVHQQAKRDASISTTWNYVGVGLALFGSFTAPVINLTGDAISLLLLLKQTNFRSLTSFLGGKRNQNAQPTPYRTESERPAYHHLDVESVLQAIQSDHHGLTSLQANERRSHWGSNELVPPTPPSPAHIFLGQFKDLSTLILLGAAGLSFATGEMFGAICMVCILNLNALVATWQQVKSNSVLDSLKTEDRSSSRVLRNGKEVSVLAKELVPGDIVILEPGDMVPADLRLLEANNVEVNEAMLTGESLPVRKKTGTVGEEAQVADRTNLLYMGTMVSRGRATAIVIHTGSQTEMGRLQTLLLQDQEKPTFLQTRVSEIGKRFVTGALAAAALVSVVGLLRGIPPLELLFSTITLAASAIPEGLPLTITIALTAGILRMSKRKAVVKKLDSLESLGRVTVICSDKTGTLTRNEMTVKQVATIGRNFRVSGDGYIPKGDFYDLEEQHSAIDPLPDADLRQLMTVGILCNNTVMDGNGAFCNVSDPTEAALLVAGMKAGLQTAEWNRLHEIPFDSEAQSMSVVCEQDEQANLVCLDGLKMTRCSLYSKGAPEVILDKCTYYLKQGRVETLTDSVRHEIEQENAAMASQALRVLGFAFKPVQDDEDPTQVADDELVYVGLMGLMDPPKEEVTASIEEARRLGIKPVMITGDHPLTARSIGVQLSIYQPGDRIVTGVDLDRLSLNDLSQLLPNTSIFARVSPEHKLRIVEAYQNIGHVVAMTGDGVNDAPAILKADVGIAMGSNGTDITKSTAGIVLMEDSFQSILDGIKEGRTIIGNMRKAIGCLLGGNLAEVLVTALSVLIGLPIPFIPLQILLMNVLTDAIPATVLATEARDNGAATPYKDVVDRPLYQAVLTRGGVLGLGGVAVFGTAIAMGLPLAVAQTMTFTSLVVGQLMHIVAWRNYESNDPTSIQSDKPLLISLGVSLLTLALVIYVPGLQGVFSTVPLGLRHWGIIGAVDFSLMWVAEKWMSRPRNVTRAPVLLSQVA